jgi:predicted transcriptional regulator
VIEALSAEEDWSTSTVKTLLRRLVEKGHLRARRAGPAFVYAARRSPRRALFDSGEELLRRAREDTVGPLLAHLVKRSRLTTEDLAELRRLVEDEEKRRSR